MTNNCPFDITPLAQPQVITTPNIFSLNYTNQDYYSMKMRLRDYIKQEFPTDFNDFIESSMAIMLIENMAFIGDTLSFKIDQIANEIFIDTVTELDNMFRITKITGFQAQPPIAASSMWTASLNTPQLTDITIGTPFGLTVQSGNTPIQIELFPADANNNPIFNQDILIPAGSLVNSSIVGLQGQTYNQTFRSTGAVGQNIQLNFSPVIWDSVQVMVDGVQWTQVDYFTDSQPRREFRVEFDSNYIGYVIFGNGTAGLVPSNGSSIQATYRVGGGVIGNITTGYVQTQTIVAVPGFSYSVPVNLRNYTAGQYGYDGDTIEDIRTKFPSYNRMQNRAVTGLDYKTFADQFVTPYQGQVGKATVALRNHGCAGNIIDLYILAANGANGLAFAGDGLKQELNIALTAVQMFTDYVCIRDGIIVLVEVTLDVVLDKSYRKFEDEYRTRVTRLTTQFFSLNNWDFGQTLRNTDLIKTLSSITEITRFESNFVTDDPNNSGSTVVAQFNEILVLDTINIAFIYQ